MSSVLETFYLLFDSNSDKVKQGTDDAKRASDNLESSLTASDRAGVALGEHLVSALGEVATAFAAVFSVEKLTEVISATADYNAQLAINSDRLGVSVEDIDAWSKATEHAGGTSQGFIATLDFLNRGLAGLNTPGGTSRLKPFLEELKIAPKSITDSLSLLTRLADKSKELGAVKFAGIAERFGLDPGTQLLIAKGSAQLAEQIKHEKELGVATRANAEESRKYKQQLDELDHQMERLATSVNSTLLPVLTRFLDDIGKFVEYLGNHKGLVEGFFAGVGGVILTFYTPAIVSAAEATWALLAPILAVVVPIAAAGLAIALLTDDVKNFLEGNKSVIGELSERWPIIGEAVRGTVAAVEEAFDWFKDLLSGLLDYGTSIVELLASVIGTAGKVISGVFASISKTVNDASDAVGKSALWGPIFHSIGEGAKELIATLKEVYDFLVKIVELAPAYLHVQAANARDLTQVAEGKETYADYEAKGKQRFNDLFAPKPATVADDEQPGVTARAIPRPTPTGVFTFARPAPVVAPLPAIVTDKIVQQSVVAAQAHIALAHALPVSSIQSSVHNEKKGDMKVSISIEKMMFSTNTDDAVKYGEAAAEALARQFKQAIAHYDDGVKG